MARALFLIDVQHVLFLIERAVTKIMALIQQELSQNG